MASGVRSRPSSRLSSRCCSCMKNGRCIRCQCVKNGRSCVDCWPSLSSPVRCENIINGSRCSATLPTSPRSSTEQVPIISSNDSSSDPSLPITSHLSNDHAPNISSSNSRSDTSLPTPSPTCASVANSDDIQQMKRLLCQPCRIIKRIPRASRVSAAKKLASAIDQVVIHNDIPSWCRLLQFPKKFFRMPCRGGKRWNLATLVNKSDQ